jgi:hypothetical protein
MRITVSCPEALIYSANQLAVCLSQSWEYENTFNSLSWQDEDGNLYSCASWEAPEAFLDQLNTPLQRPDWDVEEEVDMDAAALAYSSLVIWDGEGEITTAKNSTITAIVGPDGVAGVSSMKLSAVLEL